LTVKGSKKKPQNAAFVLFGENSRECYNFLLEELRRKTIVKNKRSVLKRIAEHTGIAPNELTIAGLEALLRQKKREIVIEKLEILSRYGASTVAELEQKIKKGKGVEHPA